MAIPTAATLSALIRAAFLLPANAAAAAVDDVPLTKYCDALAAGIWGNAGGLTDDGGFAIVMTNKTGAASVKGTVVEIYDSAAVDNAFDLAAVGDTEAIGVVYDAGIADGDECRVVVSGIAEVLVEAASTIARGSWVATGSATAGRARMAASPAAAPAHFEEIGHCLESKVNGGNTLARCVLHFN